MPHTAPKAADCAKVEENQIGRCTALNTRTRKRSAHAPRVAIFATALLAALTTNLPAEERKGIAFVHTPEQSGGVCVANTAEDGFACATKKCVDGGASGKDCIKTNWCQPAGWSVDVFLQHNEGVHWHEISCGWATKSAALAAAKILCDPKERQYVVDCLVTALYDPSGKTVELPEKPND